MELEDITHETIAQEKALNSKILKATRQEEETLRIKSRQLWLKGGDKNTDYFHKQTKNRRSCNYIKELKNSNNQNITEQDDIKKMVWEHFNQLFSESANTDPIS